MYTEMAIFQLLNIIVEPHKLSKVKRDKWQFFAGRDVIKIATMGSVKK